MRKVLFIVIMVLICFSTQGFAATLISDNFDSYTAGNIPPSPWIVYENTGSVRVSNAAAFSSPSSVAVTAGDADTNPYLERDHLHIANQGTYEAYLRTNDVTDETLVMNGSGSGNGSGIGPWISLGGPNGFGIPPGHLAAWDGSAWTDVMAISNNTWYHIKLVIDVPSKTYDIYVDDMVTPVVTGVNFHDSTVTSLSIIAFVVFGSASNPNPSNPGVDYAFVDNVVVLSATSVPTMTQWGMIIFMALAGIGAVYYLRRQKRATS